MYFKMILIASAFLSLNAHANRLDCSSADSKLKYFTEGSEIELSLDNEVVANNGQFSDYGNKLVDFEMVGEKQVLEVVDGTFNRRFTTYTQKMKITFPLTKRVLFNEFVICKEVESLDKK